MGIQLQKRDGYVKIALGTCASSSRTPSSLKPPGQKLGGFSFTEKAMYGKKPMKPAKPGKYGPKK